MRAWTSLPPELSPARGLPPKLPIRNAGQLRHLRVTGAQHFLEGGLPPDRLEHAVLEQVPHSTLSRHLPNLLGRSLGERQFTNNGRKLHHLKDADPTAVAGLVAVGAAGAA